MKFPGQFLYIFTTIVFNSIQHGLGDKVKPQDPVCSQAMGLNNKKILDSWMTTPPGAVTSGKEGKYARLNNNEAWCIPQLASSEDVFRDNIHLEINLGLQKQITALAVQGLDQYSPGKKIRLQYDLSEGIFLEYDHDLVLEDYEEGKTQYLILDPSITTQVIRIKLQSGSNVKCLRAELYGCGNNRRTLEYYQCPKKEEIMTSRLRTQAGKEHITVTDFLQATINNDGEKLLFSEAYAWCVQKNFSPSSPYPDHAQVDLTEDYLVYGLKVDGFRDNINVNSDKNIATHFKIQYGMKDASGNQVFAWYNGAVILDSLAYRTATLTIDPPLAARFVRIYMRVNGTDATCIKLQLYGCKASLKPVVAVSTTQSTNFTNSTRPTPKPSTTTPVPARIALYEIPQGQSPWADTKYKGNENSKGELKGGVGCLVDGKGGENPDPLVSPECWIGWRRYNVTNPFVKIDLTRSAPITGIRLRTYINEGIEATTIKQFVVRTYKHFGTMHDNTFYVCAPKHFYYLSPRVIDFELNLGSVVAQYITIQFEYSSDLILLRQVVLKQDKVSAGALKMSEEPEKCVVPVREKATGGSDDSSTLIVIIICVVLALLLLGVIAFIITRTSVYKKFKVRNGAGQPLMLKNSYEKNEGIHFVNGGHSPQVSYKSGRSGRDVEEVYAAPELALAESKASLALSADASQYAQYNLITDSSHNDSNPNLYAAPDAKQYAQPNNSKTEQIYQASAIYASTYENPYKAVASSTLVYADPSKMLACKLPSLRNFPREQLSFKEKIGVGQFGEVHIAEATGLDDIYGSIGHYNNSWGLPDTADVAVKVLKCDEKTIEDEFMKEVSVMAELKHENVVRLLGVCRDKPMIMVCEYMENGDLNQFLRKRRPVNEENVRASMIPADALLVDSLVHMAQQVAAGMKYLHSEGFIHRDLATRNCLVGPAYQVKIADFGLSRNLYEKHYYRVEGKAVLPIRWMAPECLFYGKFTNQTDVWSFGVTLWEIFSYARESPYTDLSDTQIIEAACESVQAPDRAFVRLQQPEWCPDEVYVLMTKCWQKEPDKRPPFAHLNRRFIELSSSYEGDI